MGAYLSTPIRDKISLDGSAKSFSYGASSMQGWRISQEDAHNCCPTFDDSSETALFAVYDGHGGAEVAQYMAQNFPEYLKSNKSYKEGNMKKALEEAFLGFDALLTKPEIIEQLQEIAGTKTDEADDDMDVKEETKMLFEEAHMPIEKLLARYKSQKQAVSSDNEPNKDGEETDILKTPSGGVKDVENSDKISNGSDDHGLNGDVQAQTCSVAAKETLRSNGDGCVSSELVTVNVQNDLAKIPAAGDNSEVASRSNQVKEENSKCGASSKSATCDQEGSSSCILESTSIEKNCELASGSANSSLDADEPGMSSGQSSNKKKSIINDEDTSDSEEDDDDNDDDDDDDDGEDWHAGMIDGDDDDDEPDEEEEECEDDDDPTEDSVLSVGEEPGADSGCTAVVAVMRGKELIVANAGDSRCVLCRGGQAIDMSFDHKPESPIEQERITKAGGHITIDGRVNGGLNLSRAIGDHCYKRNTELPLHEQMITALPDLQSIFITDDDEFILLACDGIWNMMTSQDAVTFVRDRLRAGQTKLSLICEEMFDYCLAPDTTGDGTGCDNMTAIIVLLNMPKETVADVNEKGCSKRSSDAVEGNEENVAKRAKTNNDNICNSDGTCI